MPVERSSFNHESHIRKLFLVKHGFQSREKLFLYTTVAKLLVIYLRIIWARVCVQNVNIFEIILSITSSNNIKFTVYESHGMSCSCFRVRIVFRIPKVVAVFPCRRNRVKSVKVVKAESVRARTSK